MIQLLIIFVTILIIYLLCLSVSKKENTLETFSNNQMKKHMDYLLNNPKKTSQLFKNIFNGNNSLGNHQFTNPKNISKFRNELDNILKLSNNKANLPDKLNFPKLVIPKPKPQKINKKKRNIYEQKKITKKITARDVTNQNFCKFVSSSTINDKCPVNYPVFTGASFSGSGTTINCDGNTNRFKKAQAVAVVYDGSLREIKIIDKGYGYDKEPAINIIGNGINGSCKARIKNNTITKIEIINKGSGYTSTPIVNIDDPNINLHCKLCCKTEL